MKEIVFRIVIKIVKKELKLIYKNNIEMILDISFYK